MSRAEAGGSAADLSVGAGPVLDKHGWGVGFVVAKNRFSRRRAERGLMQGLCEEVPGMGRASEEGLLSSVGFSRPPPSRVAPGDRQWRCPQVSTGGQAGGPGSLQKDPIPQDLGCPEGPPGRQVLPVQQHAGLGAHEKQVIARLPWHIHQVADGPRAAGVGGMGGGPRRAGAGCSPSSPPTPQRACGAPRAEPHVSCFSSFRITREPRLMQRPASPGAPIFSQFLFHF